MKILLLIPVNFGLGFLLGFGGAFVVALMISFIYVIVKIIKNKKNNLPWWY
jgi:hypothetical protein